MMRRFLTWLMSGRAPPVLVAAGLGAMPLLDVPSAAVIGLVALRRGAAEGVLAAIGATLVLAGLGLLMGGNPWAAAAPRAVLWSGVLLLATVLRRTGSLGLTIQIASLLSCILVAAFFVRFQDPAAYWLEWLKKVFVPVYQAAFPHLEPDWSHKLPPMARLMTGMVGAGAALVSSLAVLLARWAQAVLYNPGGLQRDFHALSMGRTATLVASAVFIAAGLTVYSWLDNLAIVLLVMFMYQGVAVVHSAAAGRQLNRAWLAGFYVIFLLVPLYMLAVVSGMGLIDNWFDLRALMARGGR